ncbi:MAG: hypothetical protein ACLP19_10520 [Xanthobacteraceae bacterium]
MAKSYSIEPLNDLSLLAGLLIKFGGEFPLLPERRRVWLRSKVDGVSALSTGPASDLIEPTKDYFFDMAAMAAKLQLQLVKHAENHDGLQVLINKGYHGMAGTSSI